MTLSQADAVLPRGTGSTDSSDLLSPIGRTRGYYTPLQTPCAPRYSAVPPSTPVKRKRTDTDVRTGFTPSSPLVGTASKRARLADIEAGLRARQEEETRRSQQNRQPQQQEEETQPEASQHLPRPGPRYSFLGLPPTQESEAPIPEHFTPKRPSSEDQDASSTLLTPPQTSQHRTGRTSSHANGSRPEPTTPTRSKGKGRAHPQFDRFIQEETEDLFMEGSSTDKDALPLFSFTQESSLEPLTTAEQINAGVASINECVQTLSKHFENFAQMDPVKHIIRLERQKNAFELGDSIKKQRIVDLSAENEILREKLRKSEEESRSKDRVIQSLNDKIDQLVSQI